VTTLLTRDQIWQEAARLLGADPVDVRVGLGQSLVEDGEFSFFIEFRDRGVQVPHLTTSNLEMNLDDFSERFLVPATVYLQETLT
jgi:hypothetical protein